MSQQTTAGPKTRPPLTPSVRSGELLFCSGQVPVIDGVVVSDDPREQTLQVLRNLEGLLEGAGTSLAGVVKCTCFVREAAHLQSFNEAYEEFLAPYGEFPARTTVIAAPPNPAVLVEIDAICATPPAARG